MFDFIVFIYIIFLRCYMSKKTELADGSVYYQNEFGYHREDGPAIILPDRKIWMINGKKHRLDGPAVEGKNVESYYINDELFSREKFIQKILNDNMKKANKEKNIKL